MPAYQLLYATATIEWPRKAKGKGIRKRKKILDAVGTSSKPK